MSTAFCRDCLADASPQAARCGACGSPRVLRHGDLTRLSIAHVDCDAFYATIEKRDDPSLAAEPVIVGGGKRGVVAACCYVARTFGVRSAMPMFEALRLCPQARVIRPNMEKYAKVGREVRRMMLDLTPLVEPLSIDEAFLDLSGTGRLHGLIPAKVLARFAAAVEKRLSITVSIGLSCNKFLAKIASDLDKPRGFAVLGAGEAQEFLAPKPVSFIFGVGRASAARLARDGLNRIADLQKMSEVEMMRRYGDEGRRLARLARGIDQRKVSAERETKSVSSETTFEQDISDFRALERILWTQTEEVSARLKEKALAGATVTLKLKTADFKIRTRAHSFPSATQLAGKIFDAARALLERETDGTKFRLLGVGLSALTVADLADPADFVGARAAEAEHAIDRVRARFGDDAVVRGLAFDGPEKP
ncbi:MAG TPA: DNA polymerase IV [Xanthobacteraceae bacterium]|nr:DNA polymerase IV [Xanthobacteraceae bacterium]